jgi:hypothetical protein
MINIYDEIYDLPTVVNLSRLSYLIVRENFIIFYYKTSPLSSIEEPNNLEKGYGM